MKKAKQEYLTDSKMKEILTVYEIVLESSAKAYIHYKTCLDMYIETLNELGEYSIKKIYEFCTDMFISLVHDFY